MPFAVSSTKLGDFPSDASESDRGNHFAVFDDPDEWTVFSQPCNNGSEGVQGLWESQVMVQGMHCAACSLTLEQTLLGIKGVITAHVSAASQRASVVWSSTLTRPSEWMAAPLTRGYQLLPASNAFASDHLRKEARLALWRWLVAGFCMMQVMMYAVPAYMAQPGDITPDIEKLLRWASWVLTLPVVFFSCGPFFGNAIRDLKHRSISMDLPVALAIVITFAISTVATFESESWWSREVYFDSLTMFVFFLLTGRWLEQRLRNRTAGSLESLMRRLPESIERQTSPGSFERVTVRRLVAGDLIRVMPGEAFPADGVITAGDTFADEALLSGESRPVRRPVGSDVLAGTYNLTAAVNVQIKEIGQATRYAQIVALMERASIDKPRLAILADRVAKPFLWFVLLAAFGAAAFWWNTDPAKALMAAVAVLVVTCPCALSLATPSAMLTSAGLLARQGVLVRRLQAFESLANVDTVIFDKTGTLTETRMGLKEIQTRTGLSAAQALQLACALAQHSLHPVSRALLAAGSAKATVTDALDKYGVADVREVAGKGLEGKLAGVKGPRSHDRWVRLGSADFCGIDSSMREGMQVCLADEEGWLARFDFEEIIRPDAKVALKLLQDAGIEVQMLSGDRTLAAQRVASQLGIAGAKGDCTPQSKLEHLQALQREGRRVLMVGDGMNDGPVLASAHVSVAVGKAVPLAHAQCDFLLPGAQLLTLPKMLFQARRTMHIVRQNMVWAATYNAVCVPWALTGWLPAWLAGLGMALSSLLVIANAARLSHMKEKG